MTKIEDRFWIEIDCFVHSSHPTKPHPISGIKKHHTLLYMLHTKSTQSQSFTLWITFKCSIILWYTPTSIFNTILWHFRNLYRWFWCAYRTTKPSKSTINEYISGKIVLINSNTKVMFPAFNISNNFATNDYDAHINTKINYTINHVFLSMTVQELNTLHTV